MLLFLRMKKGTHQLKPMLFTRRIRRTLVVYRLFIHIKYIVIIAATASQPAIVPKKESVDKKPTIEMHTLFRILTDLRDPIKSGPPSPLLRFFVLGLEIFIRTHKRTHEFDEFHVVYFFVEIREFSNITNFFYW